MKSFFVSLLPFLLLAACSVGLAATADTSFQQGVSAFRQGEYSQARSAFEQALRQGVDTPGLHYNLGVTYYRLGEYALAARHFERLTILQEWRGLAHYNLALVAEKRGSQDEALDYFGKVVHDGDPKLASLARSALIRLQGPQLPHWLFASVAYGYDDNVTLIPDAVSAEDSSPVWEAFVNGRRYLSTQWSLEGLAYGLGYRAADQFDTTLWGGKLHRESRHEAWRFDQALGAVSQSLNGEHYQAIFSLASKAERALSSHQAVQLQAELARLQADDPFRYLQGWRLRAEARWLQFSGAVQWQWSYRLELNRRADWETDDEFASFSPRRHRLRSEGQWPLTERLMLRAALGYESSHYDEPYRSDSGDRQRRDHRLTASARLDMPVAEHWRLFGKFTRAHNSSTLERYDYQRSEVLVGLEYTSL